MMKTITFFIAALLAISSASSFDRVSFDLSNQNDMYVILASCSPQSRADRFPSFTSVYSLDHPPVLVPRIPSPLNYSMLITAIQSENCASNNCKEPGGNDMATPLSPAHPHLYMSTHIAATFGEAITTAWIASEKVIGHKLRCGPIAIPDFFNASMRTFMFHVAGEVCNANFSRETVLYEVMALGLAFDVGHCAYRACLQSEGLLIRLGKESITLTYLDGVWWDLEASYALNGTETAQAFAKMLVSWVDGAIYDHFDSQYLVESTPREEKGALLAQKGMQHVFVVGDGKHETMEELLEACKDVFVSLPAGWLHDEVDPTYAASIGLARYSLEVLKGYDCEDDLEQSRHAHSEL